jgi:hypothetical protein
MFRDAPNQRLQPLLSQIPGATTDEQRANLLNQLRKYVAPLFPAKEKWTWPVLSEVMLARLEGSRRALKGTLFEGIVRTALKDLFTKTRETMGGGHALLFTRDIHKSISVAHENGFECIPIVIAESWSGNLEALACEHHIYIKANPNQTTKITPLLDKALKRLILVFRKIE